MGKVLGIGGGSKRKPIAPPPAPEPVAPAPRPESPDIDVQKERDRRRQRISQAGRQGTILTAGQPLAGSATLLGRSQ